MMPYSAVRCFSVVTFLAAVFVTSWLHAEPSSTRVSLRIKFGDGKEKSVTLAVSGEMTVADFLMEAQKKERLTFKMKGEGKTAFLTEIDGVKNEGGLGKNWVFRVNDELGDRSFAVFPVKAGDKIEWKFDTYP